MTFGDDIIRNAPLLQAMLGYAAQGRISFHMPGHQDGAGLPMALRQHLAELDATELAATDDLNDPAGPAADAMRLAAEAFHSAETLFVTGGSTTALQAMLTAFCPRGSLIVLPRPVHRSVLNLAILLQLKVAFISAEPAGQETAFARPILPPTTASLRQALVRHPDARAVLVTSPDYFGSCPDVAALASTAAEFGCPLLVDEAHGAHLGFAPGRLPPSALAAGASACVQSAHKTLPALTQGAYLHRSAGAFLAGGRPWPDEARLRQCLKLYQTSSPSLMIGATLDYARARMQEDGAAAIDRALAGLDRFRAALSDRYRCTDSSCFPAKAWRDPLRLVIDVLETGLTGLEIAGRLAAQRIDVEMADLRRLVLIPGLFQREADLVALAEALNQIAPAAGTAAGIATGTAGDTAGDTAADTATDTATGTSAGTSADRIARIRSLDEAFYRWLQDAPDTVVEPASPILADRPARRVRLASAEGLPVAEALVPYPPGIPLVWPGERLDGGRLALLRVLLENGFCVHGVDAETENSGIRVMA